MRVVSESETELVLEHRPIVLPALAAALVVGVVIQTLRFATSNSAAEWAGASAGILAGEEGLPEQILRDPQSKRFQQFLDMLLHV